MTNTTTDFLTLALAGRLAQNAEAPKKGATMPTGDNFVLEPKYDGWRILAYVSEDGVKFFSRSGKSYTLPLVAAELAAAFPPGTWLDGEASAYSVGKNGMVSDDWHVVQTSLSNYSSPHAAKIKYMVFDLIAHGEIDARPLTFAKRRALLERIFDGANFEKVTLTEQRPATVAEYEHLTALGFEGGVVKSLNAKYASNQRGHGWTKVKPTKTIEGVIMGFQPGKNGFAGMVGAVIFGQHDENGDLIERGKVSGMDGRTRLRMTDKPDEFLGKVIEVAHEGVSIGATDSGRFRFPRFKRMRPDRAPQSVNFHDE